MSLDLSLDLDLDVARLRGDFPALSQRVNGRPLVYLDNAATTHKPQAVIDAISGFYARDYSNIHRGVHALSRRATAAYEGARETVQRFLNAAESREIIFVRGATEAINLVAQSFVRPRLGAGDEVLVTAMEHHANLVPWQLACKSADARLSVLPIDRDGALDLTLLDELLTDRTRLMALAHVSNALGTVNPVAEVIAAAHARDIPVLVDGAQAVQHLPVDVQALGADFYVFSGHKLYGPTGIGALYGRADLLSEMPPWQSGGDMIDSVTFACTTFAEIPSRFEAGTPHIAGAAGLAAAIDYLAELGLPAIATHEAELLATATAALAEIPGVRIIGTAPERASVVSFVMEGVHPHDIGTILDQEGVAIRTGHHCSQPVMDFFGVPATARASFALYNDLRDVEALVAALRKVRELFA